MPVWREVLADLETPVSAFVKLVGSSPNDPSGFLLESVEHAERWGRFTFFGRDPALTLVVRGSQVEFDGVRAPGRPVGSGRAGRARSVAGDLPGTAPRRVAAVPWWHRRLSRLRRRARDRAAPGGSARRQRSSRRGDVAHRPRHRVRSLPPAALPDRERLPRGRRRSTRATATTKPWPSSRLESRSWRVRCRTCPRPRRSPPTSCCRRCDPRWAAIRTAMPWKRRVSTSSPATSSRSCSRSGSTSTKPSTRSTCTACCGRSIRRRTCTSSAIRRSTLVGSSPEPMVQVLDGRVISRPIAGTRFRGRTEEHDRHLAAELSGEPEGARRARDARRPRAERRRPRGRVRNRAAWTS